MTLSSSSLSFESMLIVTMLVVGCTSVPLDSPKQASVAIEDTSKTLEAFEVSKWLGGRTDVNGFYPLTQGFDAFGSRLALMAEAEASIDAQYFMMKPDYAGLVFAGKLLEAADRGVRVRFLLDDVFTTVEDIDLAMLNDHPNIEVRIFNPTSRKGVYAFNYLGNIKLANRRMHNKAFIIDNQVAIVGGRNIADEYFQLESSGVFVDFDMLSAGPIVKEVSKEFDTYWNHKLAVPIESLFIEADKEKIEKARKVLMQDMADAGDSIYAEAISTPLMKGFFDLSLVPYIAQAHLITDDPQKLLVPVAAEQQFLANEIREILASAENVIYIFTPYFIPRKQGVEFIKELRAKGVRVVILTNSLATNNHTAVHSSYSSYRKDLLKAGVELWEARADAATVTTEEGVTKKTHLTLHTKGILIDQHQIYVGSLNFDPRSIDINTEMGLLIDSPEMSQLLTSNLVERIPKMAYRLKLDANEKITWHATIDGQEVIETTEPQTSGWHRFTAWFLKIAPDKQL